MIVENSKKINVEQLFSLLKAAQRSGIYVRPYLNQNGTIDFSTLGNSDDADQPNPLRLPEIIIVIFVLLLWCGSILIFIRHSELLRIRHRDLPFRSSTKPPMSLSHTAIVTRTSDVLINSKSGFSSGSGLTPPIGNHMFRGYRHGETIEAISPSYKQRRHTHSYDFNRSTSTKYSSDKHSEKENFLHPHHISSDIKQSLLDLHRKSADNLLRKSMDNVSTIKYFAYYSANDMSTHKHHDGQQLIVKKRRIQESPV